MNNDTTTADQPKPMSKGDTLAEIKKYNKEHQLHSKDRAHKKRMCKELGITGKQFRKLSKERRRLMYEMAASVKERN